MELKDPDDWKNMIAFVVQNLNKKKASYYKVEIFDGLGTKDKEKIPARAASEVRTPGDFLFLFLT